MDLHGWDIALMVVVPPVLAVTVGVLLVRRWIGWPASRMRAAARRLNGRLDPFGERSRSAAILTELEGRLLRVSHVAVESRGGSRSRSHALEICTPVENSGATVAAVRIADEPWALDLVSRDVTSEPMTELADEGVLLYGRSITHWPAVIFRDQPAWAILELDSRMLRVVTCCRDEQPFDADAIERLVRGFASVLPGVLRSAGVSGSSARREQE
jgi:hypothetical protein